MSLSDPFIEKTDCGCDQCASGDINPEHQGSGDTVVRGLGDLKFTHSTENGKHVYTGQIVPYKGAPIELLLLPASVERGNLLAKDQIQVSLEVDPGTEEVSRISMIEPALDELNPLLPFVFAAPWPDATNLGDTEVITAIATVNDARSTYGKSVSLVRTTRIIDGVINIDPREATYEQLLAAAMDFTLAPDGITPIRGKLVSTPNGKVTYPCRDSYWFRIMRADWNPRMKSDFDFEPVKRPFGIKVINPVSGFDENLQLYCGLFRNSFDVTFTYF